MTDAMVHLATALAPDFEILRLLGRGAMGEVWLARETALRRLVAIKLPLPALAADPAVRARFEREARAAARLRHHSIAAVHRISRLPDGTPYLVMEYVDGPTLADVLAGEGPLPLAGALTALGQMADALAEAHARGVIHRDVRPGNIIWVAEEERAVLTDFGIAGILESGSEAVTRLTRPGEVLGDAAYGSPEQLLGETITPAADIYGWGLLAFETLTGQRPFAATSPDALGAAHLRLPPRSLRDALPDADPKLAQLVARCLAKEPKHRPPARSLARSVARLRPRSRGRADDDAAGLGRSSVHAVPVLSDFLAELRRRRVYNVAFGYAAIAFILLQGAELILPALPLSEWIYTVAVAATLAGFPVALVLAWLYDLTAGGIRRTDPATPAGPRYLRWLLPALGLLVSLALAVAIGWWVLRG